MPKPLVVRSKDPNWPLFGELGSGTKGSRGGGGGGGGEAREGERGGGGEGEGEGDDEPFFMYKGPARVQAFLNTSLKKRQGQRQRQKCLPQNDACVDVNVRVYGM